MRLSQDVTAGAAAITLAAIILIALSRIPTTSYQMIAPDLFPRLCAIGLGLGGAMLLLRGLLRQDGGIAWPALRPTLLILVAVIGFGWLAPRFGYAPAGFFTLVVSGLASREHRLGELFLFSAATLLGSVLLFSTLLKLPIAVLNLPGFRI